MFMKALYDYAVCHRLLDSFPLERRDIHLLIPLTHAGELRSPYLLSLRHLDPNGKERPGREYLMPRFPGSNSGGKANFLAYDATAVLGRNKDSGEPIPADPKITPRDYHPKAFQHFWRQIEDALKNTQDARLAALIAFRRHYLIEKNGKIESDLPFLEIRPNQKTGRPEFVARTGTEPLQCYPLKKATLAFCVDGQPLTLEDENDPLRRYWLATYTKLVFQEDVGDDLPDSEPSISPSVCLITGNVGQPIARSHKPPITGVPRQAPYAYLVSFAKDSPAFSSYGFTMGENAPVSETAATAYALALKNLLDDELLHYNLGPLAVCFWAKEHDEVARQINWLLNKAYPEQVKAFLRQPFEGTFDREVLKRERLYIIGLVANKARLVVTHWLSQSLEQALEHFRLWEEDLEVVSIQPKSDGATPRTGQQSPYAIPSLARVSLRRPKGHEDKRLITERIVQLYHAAIEGVPLPAIMLKPILDEFQSALLKDSEKKRTYPFSLSRFALIKLILTRLERQRQQPAVSTNNTSRREGGFMPEVGLLANTNDPAYNCGRLLAVLQALQIRSRRGRTSPVESAKASRPGAGVVERYYGRASSAPAMVFPLLLHLSRHHLAKLQQGNDGDRKAAVAIERRKAEIMSKLRADPTIPDAAPEFPRFLALIEQGRFALGFYQQKGHDDQQKQLYIATRGQKGEDVGDENDELTESEDVAN